MFSIFLAMVHALRRYLVNTTNCMKHQGKYKIVKEKEARKDFETGDKICTRYKIQDTRPERRLVAATFSSRLHIVSETPI